MPLRTVHVVIADARGELATDDYSITTTPAVAGGARIGAFDPADPDAAPLNPSYSFTGAMFLPGPRTETIRNGRGSFQLLESDDPNPDVLYMFRIQGTMVDPVVVMGVRCPSLAEHPDPLYLWQLIRDYSEQADAA